MLYHSIMVGHPKYDLAIVKQLVASGKVWFSAHSRSIDEVIRVYRDAKPKTTEDAERFVLDGICALELANFAGRTMQWDSDVADQYGIMLDNKPWYVKFLIGDDGDLEQISFHPPEKPLSLKSGETIPAEEKK